MLAAGHAASPQARRRVQLLGLTPEAVTAASQRARRNVQRHPGPRRLGNQLQQQPGCSLPVPDGPGHGLGARAPCWKATRTRSTVCARSPSPGRTCWPAPAVTGRCGSGTRRPASSAPCWKATRARSWACARSPSPDRTCWPAPADDRTVRIWDPATGQQRAVLEGHQGPVLGVCPITVAGQDLLASAGDDRTVRIWDPATGQQRAALEGHQRAVNGVCPVTVAGQDLLASAGGDQTVRIWDPATGQPRAVLEGHQGPVLGVCPITVAGQDLLASAGGDRTVRIWDPATGAARLPERSPGLGLWRVPGHRCRAGSAGQRRR